MAEGVRGGLRDACLFWHVEALKGLVIHVMATRHRSVDPVRYAAQKPRTTARNARHGYFRSRASGKQRRCGPRRSFATMPDTRDSCSRAEFSKLSGNIQAIAWSPLPSTR